MWGIISVDRSPIFSLRRPNSATQYGREHMSITALDKDWTTFVSHKKRRVMSIGITSSSGAKPVP